MADRETVRAPFDPVMVQVALDRPGIPYGDYDVVISVNQYLLFREAARWALALNAHACSDSVDEAIRELTRVMDERAEEGP